MEIVDDIINESKKYNPKNNNYKQIEYYTNISSKRKDEHRQVRWLSRNQMMAQFIMAEKIIDFRKINSWIDVASGTGSFFKYILPKYRNINECYGTDVVEQFTNDTCNVLSKYNYIKKRCETKNLYDLNPKNDGIYDLVTLSGILQILDLEKLEDTFNILTSLLNSGGILWINTLNYNYRTSNQRRQYGLWNFKKDELEEILKHYNFSEVRADSFNIKSSIVEDSEGRYVFLYGINK